MDETALYLPRLLSWMNDKIIFWQSELGCNLVQGNPRIGAGRSCAVTSSQETKQNNNYRGNNYRSSNNHENNPSCSKKSGCTFCGEQGHVSLFVCDGFKNANMTARCRFVVSNRLCWHCLEKGHIAKGCPDKKIKVCDRYSHCEIACPCDYRDKKFISGAVGV